MSQKNRTSTTMKAFAAFLFLLSSSFSQGETQGSSGQIGQPSIGTGKSSEVKGAEGKLEQKPVEKLASEKTLRDFGKMDLEILYLEKAKKIEELKSTKSTVPNVNASNSNQEQKPVVSLVPAQTAVPQPKILTRRIKQTVKNSDSGSPSIPPAPRPPFKLKSMYGIGSDLTAVLSSGETAVSSIKKGQSVFGWKLEQFLENGVVVSSGGHQAVLMISNEKVPSQASSTSMDSSQGNQLSARQLPNPKIER